MSRRLSFGATARRLRGDLSGLAAVEFAMILPVFLILGLSSAEVYNYITVRMRVSQMALHLADNAARIGNGSQLQAKTVREMDINDLFIGTDLQSGELDILSRGRMVISSLEPVASPNVNGRYFIRWQRCAGAKSYARRYGVVGQASGLNMTGMGPAGRQVTAPDNGATMFVEVNYEYTPLIKVSLATPLLNNMTITEFGSMMVRDRRDLSTGPGRPEGIYNAENVPVSTC